MRSKLVARPLQTESPSAAEGEGGSERRVSPKSKTILCEIRVEGKITGFSKWRHLHYTYEIVL